MRCPYCSKEIHLELRESPAYAYDRVQGCSGIDVTNGTCPSCRGFIVVVRSGDLQRAANGGERDRLAGVVLESVVYPAFAAVRELPREIPESYRQRLVEAERVLCLSASASAAIGRSLLQNVLREKYGIKDWSLRREIDAFIA